MKKAQPNKVSDLESQWIKSGEDFEQDAADVFFPENFYEILQKTHNFYSNSKRFIRSSLNPDFQFEVRDSDVKIWVECKFRENKQNLEFINPFKFGQLDRYRSFENSFLFLCTKIHGEQYVYFIPFTHIKNGNLTFTFLEPYRLKHGPPVRPGMIFKYIR